MPGLLVTRFVYGKDQRRQPATSAADTFAVRLADGRAREGAAAAYGLVVRRAGSPRGLRRGAGDGGAVQQVQGLVQVQVEGPVVEGDPALAEGVDEGGEVTDP